MTYSEMTTVLRYHPLVKVLCQKQGSVLIPESLQVAENSWPIKETTAPQESSKYVFKEIKRLLQHNETHTSYPIGPCTRPLGKATGSFEFEVGYTVALSYFIALAQNIPHLTTQGHVAGFLTHSFHGLFASLCTLTNFAVRPMLEVATVVTEESVRTWHVSRWRVVTKSDWEQLSVQRLRPETLLVSCVSEQYAPDICVVSQERVRKTLDQYTHQPPKDTYLDVLDRIENKVLDKQTQKMLDTKEETCDRECEEPLLSDEDPDDENTDDEHADSSDEY